MYFTCFWIPQILLFELLWFRHCFCITSFPWELFILVSLGVAFMFRDGCRTFFLRICTHTAHVHIHIGMSQHPDSLKMPIWGQYDHEPCNLRYPFSGRTQSCVSTCVCIVITIMIMIIKIAIIVMMIVRIYSNSYNTRIINQ